MQEGWVRDEEDGLLYTTDEAGVRVQIRAYRRLEASTGRSFSDEIAAAERRLRLSQRNGRLKKIRKLGRRALDGPQSFGEP